MSININWKNTDGPWKGEPDYKEWDAHGYTCYIKRHPSLGHLCGYVVIPNDHPWHGQHYDSIDATAHGGLTYAGVPDDEEGSPNARYAIGFDCAHLGDLVPCAPHSWGAGRDTYRDFTYVTRETEQLAAQVAAEAKGAGR